MDGWTGAPVFGAADSPAGGMDESARAGGAGALRREPDLRQWYRDRGTSEQFHREFKTDLALERLPSGKLATNRVVLQCGLVAYNLLRIIGEQLRHKGLRLPILRQRRVNRRVGRYRLRTIREAILLLGAMMRRWWLQIRRTPSAPAFQWLWMVVWELSQPVLRA